MKVVQRITVVTVMLLATFATAGTPASAADICTLSYGRYVTLLRCFDYVKVYLDGTSATGHFEVWEQSDTSQQVNTAQAYYTDGIPTRVNTWWPGRACTEFWQLVGGTWKRLDGEIVCSG